MNIAELQKKVAYVLGVSSSQKELAFEIFIDTVASILSEGITLKAPKVGFFQIKSESIKDKENKFLIFSSLPEDFTREDKNLYLTIDILQKAKSTSEYDSNVFSIGVGKPLLPLTMDEMPDSETSYAMLRKSIEERVKELISESDQIPNFNIWDDYYITDSSETDKKFQDHDANAGGINAVMDFVLPGLGRSDTSKSYENNNLLNTLMVDIPDYNQHYNNHEEKHTDDNSHKDDENELSGIKGDNQLSSGITIDDLLDNSPVNDNVETDGNKEFEIPDPDLSKILIEEPLSDKPNNELKTDHSVEGTISLNDFLDNSNSLEKTIDLNEYLDNKLNKDPESQVSLKDLGLDRESIEKSFYETDKEIKEEIKSPIEFELKIEEENKTGKSELNIDKPEDSKTEPVENPESNNYVFIDHQSPNETPAEPILKSIDEYEIMDWPDPLEVKNQERIEWNWGDELKEEFGLGGSETEDIVFEEVDDINEDKEPFIDENESWEQEFSKRDLFSRLERTLENEVTSLHEIKDEFKEPEIQDRQVPDEVFNDLLNEPKNKSGRKTVGDIKIKNDEKVYLEFQGPPPRYQFVEDKSPLNEKRMAITLSPEFFDEFRQESNQRFTREKITASTPLLVPNAKDAISKEIDHDSESLAKRDNYLKTFSIIISTLMVVSAVIVFFFIRNNNHPDQALNNKSVQQESIQKPATVEPQTLNSSQQQQTETPSKINSIMNIDESSDFPASATPPVPIKDRVTDLPPSSTNKKGNQPVMKQSNSENRQKQNTKQDNIEQPPSGDNGLYRTLSSDVKVNNTIYYDGKSYNFQVSSWRDKLKAETEVKRLRALGMNTFIVEAYLPQKGGKWYRVRVGSFNTEKEAQEYKNKNNLQ